MLEERFDKTINEMLREASEIRKSNLVFQESEDVLKTRVRGLYERYVCQLDNTPEGAYLDALTKAYGVEIKVNPRSYLYEKVDTLELSVRASNCLHLATPRRFIPRDRPRIEYIGELVQWTEPDLLQIRSFGKTSLWEVQRKLAEKGLKLGMELVNFVSPKILYQRVGDLRLSVRARKGLQHAGITYMTYVGELAKKSAGDLIGIRNFGMRSLEEIQARLKELGLSLDMKIEGFPPG